MEHNMEVMSYQDLVVWQKAMQLAEAVYKMTQAFPPEERYGLTQQLRRAGVSIPSNIAEGHARATTREYLHFLSIAQGSRAEAETQVLLAIQIGYLSRPQAQPALGLLDEVSRMLASLRNSLHNKLN
jgi:four helix bundle protein